MSLMGSCCLRSIYQGKDFDMDYTEHLPLAAFLKVPCVSSGRQIVQIRLLSHGSVLLLGTTLPMSESTRYNRLIILWYRQLPTDNRCLRSGIIGYDYIFIAPILQSCNCSPIRKYRSCVTAHLRPIFICD